MSRTTWMIVLFWSFIGIMLIWQFCAYDTKTTQQAIDHPRNGHFFFDNPPPDANAPTAGPIIHAADVHQTGFEIKKDTPGVGSFTAIVTVKNRGDMKGVGVQVFVRPFRYGMASSTGMHEDPDARPLSDEDPRSQFGQWINFPDLAPNESSTQSVVFTDQPYVEPGKNANPQITFESEKPKP